MVKQEYTTYAYADLWKYFINAFKSQDDKDKGTLGTYFNKIQAMRVEDSTRFVVDYADMESFLSARPKSEDAVPIENLLDLVLQDPDEARNTLRTAVSSLLGEFAPDYQQEIARNLRADVKGIPIVKEIPDLNVDDVDHPISMDAIVMEADERGSAEIVRFCWRCDEGHLVYTDGDQKPSKCTGTWTETNEYVECETHSFKEVPRLHEKVDYIELKLQQRLDRIDEKKTSIDMEMVATGRDLTKFCLKELHLADYTTVNGIVRLDRRRIKGRGNRQISNLYLDLMDIEIKPESSLTEYDQTYAELVKLAVTEDNEDADYEKLLRSICPSYFSSANDPVKEALLLLLVGSDERKNRDGSRLRGEMQILLLGDKGGGKSLLIKWLKNCRPRSIYTSGGKTSAVTLVGGMKASEDPARPARLVVGIFGIADLVIIDELEKRKPEEIDALAEPMQDSQSIHIGRMGQTREQDLSVSVVASANPTGTLAKYDITKDIFTNTKLPAWLLDRFDSIFIIRDVPNRARDEALFSHIVATRKQSKTRAQFEAGKHDFKRLADDFYPVGFVKQWVQYVRDTFHPSVADSPEALEIIHTFFNEYRRLNIRQPRTQEERDNWTKDYEMPAVQWRTLQSLLRYAEASARAHHRNKVLPKDAAIAVNIVRASIASSGLNNVTEIKMEAEEVAEIDSRVNDVAQRAVIRKQYRDANYDAKVFSEGLAKLSWKKCDQCNGEGFKFDVNERVVCDYCGMAGGEREPFDYSMLKEHCYNRRVLPRAFELMWKKCLTERLIEPVTEMPGLYHNRRKDSGNIKFVDTARASIDFEDADSLYVKSLKARNQPLKKYIDELSDGQQYD